MSIYEEIAAERTRQDAKWGEQNHPSVHHAYPSESRCGYYEMPTEAVAKARCDREHKAGLGTFASIAVEELAEVISANNDTDCRAELVQLAAVCVQWIEAIDRRASK